ncbi:helix-turn-helix domain-containing protein [Paenibacillus chitinolyticus]
MTSRFHPNGGSQNQEPGFSAKRENLLLRLIAPGMSSNEIGEALFISEKTVNTHVSHVLNTCGRRYAVQAVSQT